MGPPDQRLKDLYVVLFHAKGLKSRPSVFCGKKPQHSLFTMNIGKHGNPDIHGLAVIAICKRPVLWGPLFSDIQV